MWFFALFSVIALLLSASVEAQSRSKIGARRPAPAPVSRPISQNHVTAEDEQPDGDADASAVKGSSASNEIGTATGFAKGQPEDDFGSSGSAGSGGFVKNEEEAVGAEVHPAPEPYSFSYSADTDDGASSTREETGDKEGTITGK